MSAGINRANREIFQSIPFPYSCVHVAEYYGKDAFPEPENPNGRRYPPNQWILCKYDKREAIDLDKLALAKSDDREDTAKLNRIKGAIQSSVAMRLPTRQYGDFKNPIECCYYLLEIGVLKAMPKAVVDKQENQTNGSTQEETQGKQVSGKPSHLSKLSSNPEYVMVLRALEAVEFFGSTAAAQRAFLETFEHIKAEENQAFAAFEAWKAQAEAFGLSAEEIDAMFAKNKKARVERLASTLTLEYPKSDD